MNRSLLPRVLAAAAAGLLALTASAPAAQAQDPGLVQTSAGLLRGTVTDDARTFEGIPYAAPPVGDLRWRATEPAEPWDGVRDATAPGSQCPQQSGNTVAGDEDCLYLDVHIPRDATGPLPVLVFLHGGGLDSGSGSTYDPAPVVARGDAIVVAPNYRLGALGWLAHPGLDDPYAGNFGLADQQAALAWVREEIGAFGGDPGNVTLWGQSAGGRSTCAQLAAPGAAGLFDKAIVQSAPCGNALLTADEAERRGAAHAQALGCTGTDTAACLRDADTADLVALGSGGPVTVARRAADLPWSPVAGTEALPLQPLTAMRRGLAADVPLLLGGTSDEMRSMVYRAYDRFGTPVTADAYPQIVEDMFGARTAGAILARYPAADFVSPSIALATLLTDYGGQLGICSQLPALDAAARYSRVYAYEFAEPAPPVPGFPMGANHSADLGYFFTTPWGAPPQGAQAELSAAMIDHWTAFAADGDPGWPRYRDDNARVLSTTDSGMTDLAAGHHCGRWNRVG